MSGPLNILTSLIIACSVASPTSTSGRARVQDVRQQLIDRPVAVEDWSSCPPANAPFESSKDLAGLRLTGRFANYTDGDTWYPSWGADGRLYSPFTDGTVNGVSAWSGAGPRAVVGHATIVGDDPMKLAIVDAGTIPGPGRLYPGRYPCASLHHDGVWYLGTYGLQHASYGLNWPILGPFGGFHISTDNGETWTPSPRSTDPGEALFPEPAESGGPVKLGAPHVVDFGENMQHSPDGKMYLVGHGSTEPDLQDRRANLSWITGDQIYLARVTPTPRTVNDESEYEYFAGYDATNHALWADDFADLEPIAEWDDEMGSVTITYDAPLEKYLMCVTDGWPTVETMDTYLLESDRVTGPWAMVHYLAGFGPQAYFVNIPSKFISDDGRTAWLCYSANFTYGEMRSDPDVGHPTGSKYAMSLHEVELGRQPPSVKPNALQREDNVARAAAITVSSTFDGYDGSGLTDSVVDGYPGDTTREWASDGEKESATVRLTWESPQTIGRVWLFDRPNDMDRITAGLLEFSDGTTIPTGALPDDATRGLEVVFQPKSVEWLVFSVSKVGGKTRNIGLSEIAVFRVSDQGTRDHPVPCAGLHSRTRGSRLDS